MKHVVFLCDGAAGRSCPELGGMTSFEASRHPNMDMMASAGLFGLARTVPHGMPPGSDTANLSVFGYDPELCYTGRSPLEAASIGIDLEPGDVTYRCNLVTLSGSPKDPETVMADYSGGEITTEEASLLVEALQDILPSPSVQLFRGVTYRHCLVLRNSAEGSLLTPPHDISTRKTKEYLPRGEHAEMMLELMERSWQLLRDHPVNLDRIRRGLNPANCMWLWGEGRKPRLESFPQKYGAKRCGVISAVDLILGIGLCAGMETIPVKGITGNYHTDFSAKARAAIEAMEEGFDFVYIHIEAPDECGHHAEIKEKVWSIEQIDEKVVGPVLEYLQRCGEEWSALIMPDHPTPIDIRTHTEDPVPFALLKSGENGHNRFRFTEAEAKKAGVFFEKACDLMPLLMQD